MKNIAIVTETYPPEVNGVAITIHNIVEAIISILSAPNKSLNQVA